MTDEIMKKYGDIIALPHYVSSSRPRMPLGDRAAQFAPFAALTGYDAVIDEAEKLSAALREEVNPED